MAAFPLYNTVNCADTYFIDSDILVIPATPPTGGNKGEVQTLPEVAPHQAPRRYDSDVSGFQTPASECGSHGGHYGSPDSLYMPESFMDHRQVSSSPTSLSVRMADMALFSPEMPALPPTDDQSLSYNLSPLLPHLTLPEYTWGASSADESDASSTFSPRELEPSASLLFEAAPILPFIHVDHSTFDSRSRTRSDMTAPTAASNDRLTAPPRRHSSSAQRPEPGFFWSGTVPSTPDTPSSYGLSTPSSHGPSSPYPSGAMATLELPLHRQVSSPAGVHAANLRRKKDVQFYCKYCSAGFTAKHNLRNHLNSHEGKRPHACVLCNASFTTRGVRRRHEKTCKGPTSSLASA
ncbi:hypothetical protein B0H13DRAFT_2041888 [Mycena leptocephala]|nr:hypothetical protein B0H13DRAFT_2041888 [Mycena leptocephala]